jgi:DNA-binding CsgD family transcriptional regulator/tetratricopeptide (TPR) repeat protein
LREAALIAWLLGDGIAAREFVDRALDAARRTGDLNLEIRASRVDIVIAHGEQRDAQAAIARMRENAALARAHGLVVHEGWALVYLSYITGALQDVQAARQVSEQAGAWFWVAALQEGWLHLMEGRRDLSEATFAQIRHESRHGLPIIAAWVDAKEACLYVHRGHLDEARRLLTMASTASDASSQGLVAAERSAALGWLAWEQGRFEEACAHLARAGAETVMGTYNTISAGPVFLALRVDALLRLDMFEEASAALSAAETFNLGHNRFMAASLAAARFRLEPTIERAVHAEAAASAAPWPWLHALVGCWRGEFLHDRDAAESARGTFEAIGAQLGVDRARAVLRRLGVKLPRRDRGAGVLSPRELEVADLVAEGLSNPAIAGRLYLSRPTVARHVAHILTKLGFSSRTQIAAWAAQQRALTP